MKKHCGQRNPLAPGAWEFDPAPTALTRDVDDRRGVHVTPNKLVAIWYAMTKAARTRQDDNTGALLLLDTTGLEAHPDHDAVIERKYHSLDDLAYLVAGEFELDSSSSRDHERLAGLIQTELDGYEELQEPASVGDSVLSEIYQGPLARGRMGSAIVSGLLDLAETGFAGEIIEHLTLYYKSKNLADLPLEWYAHGLEQWRYFVPIEDTRVVRVELVEPFLCEIVDDDDEVEDMPYFTLQDTYDGIDEGNFNTAEVYAARKPSARARLEWHGTDLVRARQAFPKLASKLANPWKRGFYCADL